MAPLDGSGPSIPAAHDTATSRDGAAPSSVPALSDDSLIEINRLWTIARAFSNVAHEINNALQVVSGNAELLAGGDLDAAMRRRVEGVRAKAADAAAAINRLLAYAGDEAASSLPFDLKALVDTAVAMRAATLGRARILVTVHQPTDEPRRVAADRQSILQMLLNVLLCAEETLRARGGGRIAVRIGGDPAGFVVLVEARSSGQRFEGDASSSSEVTAMTSGAQLWVASRLAGGAHGSLEAVPMEDAGVTLRLTLPTEKR